MIYDYNELYNKVAPQKKGIVMENNKIDLTNITNNSAGEGLIVMVVTAVVSWLSEQAKNLGVDIQQDTMTVVVTGSIYGLIRGAMKRWGLRKENKESPVSDANKQP
jgi:hypothetical protein